MFSVFTFLILNKLLLLLKKKKHENLFSARLGIKMYFLRLHFSWARTSTEDSEKAGLKGMILQSPKGLQYHVHHEWACSVEQLHEWWAYSTKHLINEPAESWISLLWDVSHGYSFNFKPTTFHLSKSWEWQLHYPLHLGLLDGAIYPHLLYKFHCFACTPASFLITSSCMGMIFR